jgi:hypothetical protein
MHRATLPADSTENKGQLNFLEESTGRHGCRGRNGMFFEARA